jgi:hypothetical protein
MDELELGDGQGGPLSAVARVVKERSGKVYTDRKYTNPGGWSRTRYVGALLGKNVRAAQGAYLNTKQQGLGYPVPGLEGEE